MRGSGTVSHARRFQGHFGEQQLPSQVDKTCEAKKVTLKPYKRSWDGLTQEDKTGMSRG